MSLRCIRHVVGIDEAGRGPIAGPLALGAASLTLEAPTTPLNARRFMRERVTALFLGLRDSKQLTEQARERLFARIPSAHESGVRTTVAFVGPQVIDHHGVGAAIAVAIRRALGVLRLPPEECLVLLDGLLHAPRVYALQETIIRGDQTEPIISLASVVAKVKRDHLLVRLAKRFPGYGFERHKGYGTAAHYAAIATHGLSPIHRRSFLLHSDIPMQREDYTSDL